MVNQKKKAQEQKCGIFATMPKKAQEEMVGFAVIIVIVAVILLVFLRLTINNSQKEPVESYEVESFIQSFLYYTTECKDVSGNSLSVQKLIFSCYSRKMCEGAYACQVLNSTLKGIVDEAWKTGENSPTKGYELKIDSEDGLSPITLKEGNITKNYKGSMQELSKSGNTINITFTAYY